jgi:hypothetical protein
MMEDFNPRDYLFPEIGEPLFLPSLSVTSSLLLVRSHQRPSSAPQWEQEIDV